MAGVRIAGGVWWFVVAVMVCCTRSSLTTGWVSLRGSGGNTSGAESGAHEPRFAPRNSITKKSPCGVVGYHVRL